MDYGELLVFLLYFFIFSCGCGLFNNFLLIDGTDRSKISSEQKRLFIAVSLYPLSFFREHSL